MSYYNGRTGVTGILYVHDKDEGGKRKNIVRMSCERKGILAGRFSSVILFYVLYRVHDLVDKFHRHARDDAFSVGKRTLESTESDPSLLC